ncbi:SRPBCC family protein [Herminiimonas sp. CN]|uniref:SRPBCC family protein n=1 Tax=Herminiimonas sp. CN TaxID=1349818 RepID=UPI0004741A12|nr:SRPBCC family protein [Herminiimonas sp. CN]
MKPLLPILLLILSQPPVVAQAQNGAESAGVAATVQRTQQDQLSFFEIHASGFARSSQQRAWQVLTDYDRLHEFVPNLLSSRLLERSGPEATIEEVGRIGFFILSRQIHMVVRVTEHPFSTLDAVLVAGDMKHYATHWELAPATQDGASGTRINYSGMVEPDFFVPSLLGAALMRSDVRRMLEAIITEIDKTP